MKLSKQTVFPSTRTPLEAGISCREPGSKGWAIYWMEGGAELTLFPGDEGPQEASSIDEIIEWIGGDQPAVLTPASLKRFGVKTQGARLQSKTDTILEAVAKTGVLQDYQLANLAEFLEDELRQKATSY